MSDDDQKRIVKILDKLKSKIGLNWNEEPLSGPCFRIEINGATTRQGVFYKIPKNQGFLFQIFMNGENRDELCERLINQLNPLQNEIGGGQGIVYRTIYLSGSRYDQGMEIEGKEEQITKIIQCKITKTKRQF